MEKDHRLFLRNLPPDIDNAKLQKLFEEHGTIKNIDIKDKIQNDGSRIAFVNLTTTDGKLNTCFRAVDGSVLSGNAIRVEVAKESFLERLKREREEAANRTETSKEPKFSHDQPIEKINIKTPANIKTKPTKRIYNFDELDNNCLAQDDVEQSLNNASTFIYDPALQVETVPVKKPLKIERQIPEKFEQNIVEKIPVKKILSESEIKRLASVQQKRVAFRTKEQMISSALKAVDSSSRNRKVVFSDDIDKTDNDAGKRSKSLFDDDEDAEDQGDWNADKFKHDEKRSAKLAMSLKNLGRDKRFALDDRFLDDDDVTKVNITEENDVNDLKNEAKWQLGILENVLGKPFRAREENPNGKRQNKMVRYDPTANGHREHELEMTTKPAKMKKGKQTKIDEEPEEEAPIVVSSDVFYSVSENLTESLKAPGGFSLLETFGTAAPTDKNRSDDYSAPSNSAQGQSWDAKNPFKYESSDDEGPDPSIDQLTSKNDAYSRKKTNDHLSATKETFFYDVNDQLFHEVEEFFTTRPSTTGNFPSIRRELKLIVRSKVRNNVKKSTPWRNKKIGNKPKANRTSRR